MIKLTKKKYLGPGYFYEFKNNETGAILLEECTAEEYFRLGIKGGSKFNPVKEGYTFLGAMGGTIKVDNPNTFLGKNEYCEMPNYTAVNRGKGIECFTKDKIVNDELDELTKPNI